VPRRSASRSCRSPTGAPGATEAMVPLGRPPSHRRRRRRPRADAPRLIVSAARAAAATRSRRASPPARQVVGLFGPQHLPGHDRGPAARNARRREPARPAPHRRGRRVLRVTAVRPGQERVGVKVGRPAGALVDLLRHDAVDRVEPGSLRRVPSDWKPDPDDIGSGAVDQVDQAADAASVLASPRRVVELRDRDPGRQSRHVLLVVVAPEPEDDGVRVQSLQLAADLEKPVEDVGPVEPGADPAVPRRRS
jgi:hypothetical protein